MTRFVIDLANNNDDAELRRILRENFMDGNIQLTFQREPSFFNSLEIDGEKCQVIVGRDLQKHKIIGFGIRAIRKLYINGKPENIGYLSNLRLDKNYRNGLMLASGYRYFKELHRDGNALIYLTSIIEDNKVAMDVLPSGKAGLPRYNNFGTYFSYLIGLKHHRKLLNNGILTRKMKDSELNNILEFIQKEGKKKQFFPYYTKEDIKGITKRLYGLSTENIFIAYKNSEIVGTMAMWDQSSIKQTVVHGYKRTTNFIRHPWNLISYITNLPKLPPPGKSMSYFYGALIAIKDNDPQIFQTLLERIKMEGRTIGYNYMVVGLHSNDGLNSIMKRYINYKLKTRIFIVHWENGVKLYKSLDSRIPYIEVGTL